MTNKEIFEQDISQDKDIVIIYDNEYHTLLTKLKTAKYSSANIKLISYQKAISMISFEINSSMISLLIKNGYSYCKAKKILSLLRLLDEKRISKAPSILKDNYEIIKPLVETKPFDNSIIFKDKSIYLFNKSKDVQLKNLFKAHGFDVKDLSADDLEFSNYFSLSYPKKVIEFNNKMEQYMYVFSSIRSLLLKKPELSNKIRLMVVDEYDLYYLQYFSQIFGIAVYSNLKLPLGVEPKVKVAMNRLYDLKDQHLSIKNIADSTFASQRLAQLIKEYRLDELDGEKGYLNLKEIVSSTTYLDNSLDQFGVICSNMYSFDDNLITFVLSFQDDIFYQTFKDDDVIDDACKIQLGINPSYVNTLINKDLMSTFVKNNNIVHLSRVKQHLDEHIYDSGLIDGDKSLGLSKTTFNLNDEKDVRELLSHSFTYHSSCTLAAILAEYNYSIDKFPEACSYDYQTYGLKIKPKEKYSISDIQEYNKCPFKYLLDRKYHMSSSDDKYFAHLGTLVHSILEHIQDAKFDYDKLFDDASKQFKENMSKTCNGEYDHKYDIYVLIAKPWIKRFIDQYRARLAELAQHNIKIHHEVKFNFSIPESDYKFDGIADAILISQIEDKKYYSIIDYKTGNDVFQPFGVCVGQNIQLPLYFAGLRHSDKRDLISGCEKGGFGLKKQLANSAKKLAKNDCLSPKSINNYSVINMYVTDDEAFKDSLLIYGLTKAGKPTTKGVEQLVRINPNAKGVGDTKIAKFNIDILCSQAEKAAIETINLFKESIYPILVTAKPENILKFSFELDKEGTNCCYCKHHDICYRKPIKESYFNQLERWAMAWGALIADKGEGKDGK